MPSKLPGGGWGNDTGGGMNGNKTNGKITIELLAQTPASGSGLPDLGHDAYWLKKTLPTLEFKDANGKKRKLEEKYKVVRVATQIED
jgi:hypothetical protein